MLFLSLYYTNGRCDDDRDDDDDTKLQSTKGNK